MQQRTLTRQPAHSVQPMQPAQKSGLPRWIEWLLVLIVVAVAVSSFVYTLQSGAFSVTLVGNTQWSWFLVRSAGMVAYALLAASMLWGLFLSSHILKNWSPGPLTMVLHAATSWLALVLSIAHALLLLFDSYYTYTIQNIVIPFTGPYRPFAVGLGIIALWLTLLITVSFSLRRLIGHRQWLWLHYTSYGAFALITVHAMLAGTDATQSGVRIILFVFGAAVFALFAVRVVKGMLEQSHEAHGR